MKKVLITLCLALMFTGMPAMAKPVSKCKVVQKCKVHKKLQGHKVPAHSKKK